MLTVSQSKKWEKVLRDYQYYLFLLPAVTYFVILHYAPMYGIQLGFKDFVATKGIWGSPWAGLRHFKAFFDSYYCWRLIWNTFSISAYSIVAGFPLPIILALLLNEVRYKRYKKIVQTVTYAPHFISTVVMVGMLFIFLHPRYGMINSFLQIIGVTAIDFMNNPKYIKSIYVWSGIWQGTGWASIIYFATLSTVNPEQHEAAKIDGASKMQRIWHVNIPVIIPTATILLILNVGRVMSVGFEKVFLMQTPLNMDSADVISTYIYRVGLQGARFSFSTAVGLLNSVVNCVFLIIVNAAARRFSSTRLW